MFGGKISSHNSIKGAKIQDPMPPSNISVNSFGFDCNRKNIDTKMNPTAIEEFLITLKLRSQTLFSLFGVFRSNSPSNTAEIKNKNEPSEKR